ncbi:CRTAC1 family protein [Silicimonas algicola]|uniref:VCBS repeat protein n=1 Tax=Silicimonas algicola TaxID=1826607 RepID=A0A316GBM3_9RHOB|nr:CRTAC1 family protein [Silicimonas algicola]PWK57406.1 VCBS repeat protein [Silicimonas algicola]
MAGAVRGAIVLGLSASVAVADPAFEPVQVPEHVYAGGWEHFVGGGLAAFDCNGDALPELYAAGGTNPAALFLNRSQSGGAVHLEVATPEELALSETTGAYPLDIDSDGILDLVVLGVGGSHVLKGQGDCRFAPFDGLGIDLGQGWATAFSATWEAGRTLPTLAVGNYVDRADPKGPFEACDDNLLLRPEGDTYAAPMTLAPGHCTLSMLFSDWGRHGRSDLRVSNDRHYYVRTGEEQMWAMEKTPRLYGKDDGWQAYSIWGMGIAERDLNGDGLPEVYLTSMGDQKLQSLKPGATGPTYEDAHWDIGIAAQRPYVGDDGRASTGWHVAFGDVQNDGRDDIFVAKGNVEQMPSTAMRDPNNLLVQAEDGTFDEWGDKAGVASMARSRGAAMVDLNADGLLDLAVVNRRAPLEVYRNVTPSEGGWIAVELRQDGINPFAVGAWIDVRTGERIQSRQMTVGGGHAGGSLVPEHFGLGPTEEADLRVTWPDGTVSDWVAVDTSQTLRAVRNGATLTIETGY